MVFNLYSLLHTPTYDMTDAAIHFDTLVFDSALKTAIARADKTVLRHTNKELRALEPKFSTRCVKRARDAGLPATVENTFVYPTSARGILGEVMDAATTRSKDTILVPVPNWRYWNAVRQEKSSMRFVLAHNEDELVHNAQKAMQQKRVAALVLAQPTSPLFYMLSQSAVQSLDATAAKHGIALIIDDLFRCRLEGKVYSNGKFCTQSRTYVVEGHSKQFGANPMALTTTVTYLNNARKITSAALGATDDYMTGAVLSHLKKGQKRMREELIARNTAFDTALHEGGLSPIRPSMHYPVTRIDLPVGTDDVLLKELLCFRVGVNSMSQFYPTTDLKPSNAPALIRASVGRLNTTELYEAGRRIAEIVHRVC
jgi:aspartate/methionine/tyrosine aminotransferase